MGNSSLDWALLALILAAFWLIACHFTRLVFRTTVLAAVVVAALRVTWLGLEGPGHPGNYASAFVLGGDPLARVMLAPLLPGSATASVAVGRVGWIVLLAALLGLVACFDTWSVRREQPRVSIPEAPAAEQGLVNLAGATLTTNGSGDAGAAAARSRLVGPMTAAWQAGRRSRRRRD